MKYYYKKSNGEVVELEQVDLEQQNILNLCCEDIVELVIPDGYKIVRCYNNQLKELIVPDGCKIVSCLDNQLKELIIPEGCEYVSCWDNQLKELVIPDGCKEVWADMKSVTELNKIEELRLYL